MRLLRSMYLRGHTEISGHYWPEDGYVTTTTIDHTPLSGVFSRLSLRVAGLSSGRLRLPSPSPAPPPQSTKIPLKDRANHGGT